MCELHNHTSQTLSINWKHSHTQGNSVITVRKNKVTFVDLGSFSSLRRVSKSPLKLVRSLWIFFSSYWCYFKRSFQLAKAAEQTSAPTALSESCMKCCDPCACTNILLQGTFHLYFWFICPTGTKLRVVSGRDLWVFTWKANLCGSWVLPSLWEFNFWRDEGRKVSVVLGLPL